MAKRILTTVICVLTAITLALGTFAAVSQDDAQRLLGVLGIMNGNENGELMLEKNVTRAEFSKMLVAASAYKDNIATSAISTGFSDVTASHWAAPYIRVAAENKWIYGYSDGRFAPQSNIKLEEAATMLLRLLGYTSADTTGVYPNGQLALYEALELDDGVAAEKGELVTRGDCMSMFVNLLNAKTKGGQVYAQTLGYSLGSDGKIDIYKTVSDEMKGPYVIESSLAQLPVDASNYTVYKDDTVVDADKVEKYDVAYYSAELRTVWIYNDTVTGIYNGNVLSGSLPVSVNVGAGNYSFEESSAAKAMSVYGEFAKDDAVTLLLGKDGRIVKVLDAAEYSNKDQDGYLDIVNDTLDGPYIYLGDDLFFMTDTVRYIKESTEINVSSLKKYDILYYSKLTDTVWVYRDAVTGKYNAASPSVSSPKSVTVGSKTYSIETDEAAYDLSFMGKFEPEDMVTLLLGKDGAVAAVCSIDEYTYIDDDNYLELIEGTLKGPYIVTSTYSALGLPTSGVSVKRNNVPSSIGVIKQYDVVYYSEVAKTVMVYSKSVSGTYSSASPSTDTPAQITVAGGTYKLANADVALSVSSIGKYKPGDLVTLLLGRDDEVAFVLPMSVYAQNLYGVVLGVSSELYTDANGKTYSAKTVSMLTTDGDTVALEGITNTFSSGDIIKVTYSDTVKAERMKQRSVTGVVSENAIGDKEVAPDIKVLETGLTGKEPTSLFFSRLTGAKLKEENVRYYAIDSEGKITDLILGDLTGDSYSYGILITAESSSDFVSDDEDLSGGAQPAQKLNCVYEFQIGTNSQTLNSLVEYTNTTGPAAFKYSGDTLSEIVPLRKLALIDKYTSFGIVSDSKIYLFSDNMTVYTPNTNKNSALDYSVMTVSELTENIDSYNIKAYFDKTPENGGRIRLIVATKKSAA